MHCFGYFFILLLTAEVSVTAMNIIAPPTAELSTSSGTNPTLPPPSLGSSAKPEGKYPTRPCLVVGASLCTGPSGRSLRDDSSTSSVQGNVQVSL